MKALKQIGVYILSIMVLCGCSNTELAGNKISETSDNPIVINELKMEFKTEGTRKEIKPAKPQGYYPHYKEQDGYHYHVLYGTLENTSNKNISIDQLKVEGINGEQRYQGKLEFINQVESYFWDEIGPGVELDFYIFSLIENGDEDPNEYRFYYDEDQRLDEDQEVFDFEIRYSVPKNLGPDDGN